MLARRNQNLPVGSSLSSFHVPQPGSRAPCMYRHLTFSLPRHTHQHQSGISIKNKLPLAIIPCFSLHLHILHVNRHSILLLLGLVNKMHRTQRVKEIDLYIDFIINVHIDFFNSLSSVHFIYQLNSNKME